MTKVLNFGFVAVIFLMLLLGLTRTVLAPREINAYENRSANKVEAPHLDNMLFGTFQSSFEAALADQVFLAIPMKRAYNQTSSTYLQSFVKLAEKTGEKPQYVRLTDTYGVLDDYLLFYPQPLHEHQSGLDARINSLEAAAKSTPETENYIYYIQRDVDMNFATGEKTGMFEYLRDHANASLFSGIDCFSVDHFEDYKKWFYRTDHHWNCDGSYRAYCQVLSMMLPDEVAIQPKPAEKEKLNYSFSGSKASGSASGGVYREDFYAYHYPLPDMTVTINGTEMDYFSGQKSFFNGSAMVDISYAGFYGFDSGEIIFDTNTPERENILIIGESYDNAVLPLLAAHFNQTYSIDLRNYERENMKPFKYEAYVKSHQITKVLYIGSSSYFFDSVFDAAPS